MKYTDKINEKVHPLMVKWVMRGYSKKIDNRFKLRPELNTPIDRETTQRHLSLYKKLGLPCSDKWLRFYSNLTGIVDYSYLPEDLYAARIERILNNCSRAESEAEDKNLLSKFVDSAYLPRTILRYVRGIYYDENYNYLSRNDAEKILSEEQGKLIGKVASDSFGGHDVMAFSFSKGHYISHDGIILGCDWIEKHTQNYIVQERLEQCDFASQFNSHSVNTCRITTLRQPWDGKLIVTKSAMRFGVTNSAVDNLSSGGIAVAMNQDGCFGDCAFSYKDARPHKEHPSSGIVFRGQKHPYYKDMCDVVLKQASLFPNFNIMSWDVIADKKGDVKIIEVNLVTQNTEIGQFAFGSFFGDNTEKIIDWCATHLKNDSFKHFRTF